MADRDRAWWQELFGDRERLGWWTVPVFVMVGLAGAIIAGTLTSVYYAQQVNSLRDETRQGRQELRDAVDKVKQAGDEATKTIEDEVAAVRESLSRNLPVDDATAQGVVAIRATVGGGAPQAAPSPGAPAPPSSPTEQRIGNGFAVAYDGQAAFFATSYALVADPSTPGGVLRQVNVVTPNGTVTGQVHSWDEQHDLALVRAVMGEVTVPKWRPAASDLARGERLVTVGVTPALNTVELTASVGFSDVNAIVTDRTPVSFLDGAPVMDSAGNVVAVNTLGYLPYGAAAGSTQAVAPIHLLCESMLRNCAALEATETPSGG